MAGRDNPKVFAKSRIRSLLPDVLGLGSAGYEKGDYLTVWNSFGQNAEEYSTTSSTYVNVDLVLQRINTLPFFAFPNNNVQAAVAWEGQFLGSGRDGNNGIRIEQSGYVMAERNNQSSGGWIEFDQQEFAIYSPIETKIKSGTEGEPVGLRRFSLMLGIKI